MCVVFEKLRQSNIMYSFVSLCFARWLFSFNMQACPQKRCVHAACHGQDPETLLYGEAGKNLLGFLLFSMCFVGFSRVFLGFLGFFWGFLLSSNYFVGFSRVWVPSSGYPPTVRYLKG